MFTRTNFCVNLSQFVFMHMLGLSLDSLIIFSLYLFQSVTQKVTLMVQDVEEPPYSVSLDNNTVKENSDRSIKIGQYNTRKLSQCCDWTAQLISLPSTSTKGFDS